MRVYGIPSEEEYESCDSWDEVDDSTVRHQAVFIMDKPILATVTSEAQHARDWIIEFEFENTNPLRYIVGLDIKHGTPDNSTSSAPPLALLVLFLCRSCLIFELTYATKIPTSLSRFLSDRNNNTLVGVGIESKLLQLRQQFGIGGGARWVDLGHLTAARYSRPELRNAGISKLRTFLHGSDVERPWPPLVGKWDDPELSYEHMCEACIDAYTCYELGSFLVYPTKRGTAD
ncbi:hypothetical protein ACS0TY_023949 [Phlomoides rotata]